jgi:DNA-binding NarL/FixJ family response regulator
VKINIAIIDDHRMIAEIMQATLRAQPFTGEVRMYDSGEAFLHRADKWQPDMILMDMLMPGISGLALIDELKKATMPGTRIIIISSASDTYLVKQAIRHGINGYLSKEAQLEELINAILSVHQGEQYISNSLSQKLIKNIFIEEQVVIQLSPREKEVLRLVCLGNTIKEIASSLGLTPNTVQSYHKNIMKKFNVNKTTELILRAIDAGLVSRP